MKKFMFIIFLGLITVVCGANEYTSLERKRQSLEKEISKIEEKMSSKLRWFKYSPRTNRNFKKQLEDNKSELVRIKSRIQEIEENTTIFITRVELQDIPDFDGYKLGRGNADIRICFRSKGPRDPFISRDLCSSSVDFDANNTRMEKNDVIEIKDEDRTFLQNLKWEDMGYILCQDIFYDALRNDQSEGIFEKKITTKEIRNGENQTYTCRIYYRREYGN